jgi:hypothetical protein
VNELVAIPHERPLDAYRMSTDAAGACGEIVKRTAKPIQGRKFVSVEGWQAIAIAHGCAASAKGVERVDGGVRAVGEVRRMSDGQLIAQGEGFVGEDEAVWFGGTVTNKWGKTVKHEKRADYAIRAMAQTRAISRACRSAFAHVVVMIDEELSTTPAEEVPEGGFDNANIVDVTPQEDPRGPEPKGDPVAMVTDDQRDLIQTMAPAAGKTIQGICEAYGIPDLTKLTYAKAVKLIEHLRANAMKPADDVLDDEIPY